MTWFDTLTETNGIQSGRFLWYIMNKLNREKINNNSTIAEICLEVSEHLITHLIKSYVFVIYTSPEYKDQDLFIGFIPKPQVADAHKIELDIIEFRGMIDTLLQNVTLKLKESCFKITNHSRRRPREPRRHNVRRRI